MNAFALRVAAGEDPKSLPTYKPVSKIKLERPTRGQVIVWSRKVRAETFNTKEGRDLIKRSYIETGMMKDEQREKKEVKVRDYLYLYLIKIKREFLKK